MQKSSLRAQAGTEYLMIAGFLLIAVGIVYIYSTTTLTNSVDDAKARSAVNSIAKAIDQVYALGPGSKVSVNVDLPSGLSSQIVEDQLIGYIVNVNGTPAHYYADTKANLRGSLPLTQGVHEISLSVNNAGEVIVGESGYGVFISPRAVLISIDENNSFNNTYVFNIQNTNPSAVSGISISKSGSASGFITIGTYPATLNSGEDANFDVIIVVPNTQAVGTYSAFIDVSSSEGNDRAVIEINIVPQGSTPPSNNGPDTNWETSWTIFDANMKAQYQLVNENTLHWHDSRYYTKSQSDANWNKYILTNGDINWRQLQNYPTACPNGYAIRDINDTNFTCIAVGGSGNDTNWQTSYALLDANLRATYLTINQTASASFFDDFDGSIVGLGWTAVNSGTGAAQTQIDSVAGENTMGVLQWSAGTTTTGRAALIRNTGAALLGQGKYDIIVRAKVPTLSVVAQEYSAQLGLHDSTTKAAVDGVYFHYDRAGYADDVIRCVTASNSSLTTNSSGVTMNTSWNKYEIDINPAGTQALFYINGTLVCTHTTNIPTGAGRTTSPRVQIIKSTGTTARTLLVDYWQQDLNFTTTR